MGRGLSPLQRRILEWIRENPPLDNGAPDYNWDRHPRFKGERSPISAPALSCALRRLEGRGLIARSWSGPDHSGHVRVELVRDAPVRFSSCASDPAGGATA